MVAPAARLIGETVRPWRSDEPVAEQAGELCVRPRPSIRHAALGGESSRDLLAHLWVGDALVTGQDGEGAHCGEVLTTR